MLSYQVISAENCPCLTGARGFATFYLVRNNKETHGGVYGEKGVANEWVAGTENIENTCGGKSLYKNSENSTET